MTTPFHLIDALIYGGMAVIVAGEYLMVRHSGKSPRRTQKINNHSSVDAE